MAIKQCDCQRPIPVPLGLSKFGRCTKCGGWTYGSA